MSKYPNDAPLSEVDNIVQRIMQLILTCVTRHLVKLVDQFGNHQTGRATFQSLIWVWVFFLKQMILSASVSKAMYIKLLSRFRI